MLKVLLADDNKNTLDGLQQFINWNELNCEIIGLAENGQEALDIAKKTTPNILITDIKMPILDGIELIKSMRTSLPGLHIIILTAYDDFNFAKVAIEYGVEQYISKPIDTKKLATLKKTIMEINKKNNQYVDSLSSIFSNKSTVLLNYLENGDFTMLKKNIFSDDILSIADFTVFKTYCINVLNILYNYSTKYYSNVSEPYSNYIIKIKEVTTINNKTELMDYINNFMLELCNKIHEFNSFNSSSLINNIFDFINNNTHEPNLSPSFLSQKFNISLSYLCSLFKKAKGVSINSYIVSLRIDKAIEMIKNPNTSINDISSNLGFQDRNYFSKVFKKYTGYTPSEYRQKFFI